MAKLPDMGERIATKNRYAPASGKVDSLGNVVVGIDEKECDRLKSLYPEVFDRKGILFVLRDYNMGREDRSYGWTGGFPYAATLFAFPLCSTTERHDGLTIELLDQPDARSRIDTYVRNDSAFAMWTPSPFLFYLGEVGTGAFDGCKKSVVHDYCFFFDMKLNGGEPANAYYKNCEMRDYAIAASLKKLEDEGLIEITVPTQRERQKTEVGVTIAERFDISEFKHDADSGECYTFVLRLRDAGLSLAEMRDVQNSLRTVIHSDYVESFPSARKSTLIVDFPKYELDGTEIRGRAVVLPLNILSLDYDSNVRKGVMRIRCGERQLENARRYLRKNIAIVARDKNIALVTGRIPPSAHFYLLNETVSDGILAVEFKAE